MHYGLTEASRAIFSEFHHDADNLGTIGRPVSSHVEVCVLDENGNHVGYSVPGIGGGEDYFWDNGETGYTVDSIISGQDYYGSDGTRAYSVVSVFGGKTIHGDVSGFSVDSLFDGSDIVIEE